MGWRRLVGSLKLQVSFAEHSLFYWALLQKRPMILRSLPIILRSLLIEATAYVSLIFWFHWKCCPRMEISHFNHPRTAWCVVNMFHKNGMSQLIRTNGTILSPIIDICLPLLIFVSHYWYLSPIIDICLPLLIFISHYWYLSPIIDICLPFPDFFANGYLRPLFGKAYAILARVP